MQTSWRTNVRSLVEVYILFFLGMSIRCKLRFGFRDIVSMMIMGVIVTMVAVNTYKAIIDGEFIRIYKIVGKNQIISLKDAYKIEIQSYSWQITKSYRLVIFTHEKVYEVSELIFDIKELGAYLSKLCQEKGIEYYFNK